MTSSIRNSALNQLAALGDQLEAEAVRCADAGAWQAACLFKCAHLEAWLIATAGFLEVQLRKDGFWPTDRRKENDLLGWDLGTALGVARRARWFDGRAEPPGLADAVDQCKTIRDACTHPAAWVRDGGAQLTEDVFIGVYNVVDAALGALGRVLDAAPDPPIGAA